MDRIKIALSAFSARATQGRRSLGLVYSGLLTAALLAVAQLISVESLREGKPIDTLALADMLSMLFVGAALFVIAPAMVAAQVAEERRSGTLDLLRTAPLSPTALTAGFLAGAPATLYLVCTGPLALHAFAGLTGRYPIEVLPHSLLVVGLGSVALMLLSMLTALAIGREGPAAATPMLVAGALAMSGLMTIGMATDSGSATWAHVHPAGALAAIYASFDGPYQQAFVSSWQLERFAESRYAAMQGIAPLFAALVYFVGGAILLVAARRALAGDPPSRLTKGEAVGLFSVATAAIAIPLRLVTPVSELEVGHIAGVVASLVPVFIACVIGATPSAIGYGDGTAPRTSPRGAPMLASLLMAASGLGVMALLFGGKVLVLLGAKALPYTLGFAAIWMTLPIYALFSSTRISSNSGRLAFWAAIAVVMTLSFPSLISVVEHHHTKDVAQLLGKIGFAIGVLVPATVAWRQRLGDRRRRVLV